MTPIIIENEMKHYPNSLFDAITIRQLLSAKTCLTNGEASSDCVTSKK